MACRDSNVIEVYRRDTKTGMLTNIHGDIRLGRPVCVVFVDGRHTVSRNDKAKNVIK